MLYLFTIDVTFLPSKVVDVKCPNNQFDLVGIK